MVVHGAGAAFFTWSRSRPNLVGAKAAAPQKVAAPQHCSNVSFFSFFGTKALTLTKVPNVFGLAEFDGKDC